METTRYTTRSDFFAGIDVGGTKVHILDTLSTKLHHFLTTDYSDLYGILDAYFERMDARPTNIVIDMAGPRDEQTGEMRMTNCPWPKFNPNQAAKKYPGTTFATTNDMVAVAAGMLAATSLDLKQLKPGKAAPTGNKVVMTISTGVNSCTAAWDEITKRHVFIQAESGHTSFGPRNNIERRFFEHLTKNYPHPSVELALSGKHGVEGWVDVALGELDAPELAAAVEHARNNDQPVGVVLLEFATHGKGRSQAAAQIILGHMGSLVGHILADKALAYKASGGIYLTGSVSMGLSEYWAEETDLIKSFVRIGTKEHAPWLEELLSNIPIYLITNPDIAASGALALAKEKL